MATLRVGTLPVGVAYIQPYGEIFVANEVSNTVSVVSDSTNAVVATISVGTNPYWVTYDPANQNVYVSNYGSSSVSVINTATNTVTSTIAVGSEPMGMTLDAATGTLFVACYGVNLVYAITISTETVSALLSGTLGPTNMAIDTANNDLYVTNNSPALVEGGVGVFSLTTYTMITEILGFLDPLGVAYDSYNGYVYVTNNNTGIIPTGWISIISPTTNKFVTNITTPNTPEAGVLVDPDNQLIYVASRAGDVVVVNGNTNVVDKLIRLPEGATFFAYDNVQQTIYVTASSAAGPFSGINQLYVISTDLAPTTVTPTYRGNPESPVGATISVGTYPNGEDYDSSTGEVYVADYGASAVSVVSVSTNSLVATIPVGTNPYEVLYDATNGNIYTSNYGSNSVSVISGATHSVTATIPGFSGPAGLALDGNNGELFVADYGSNHVNVVSTTTNSILATLTVGTYPFGVTFAPSSGDVYVTNAASDNVSVIDPSTNTVTKAIPVGTEPLGIAFDPTDGDIYTANDVSFNVSIIGWTSNTVVDNVNVGGAPYAISYDAYSRDMGVAAQSTNEVVFLSSATHTVVEAVMVGNFPSGLAYCGPCQALYVSDYRSNSLMVVNGDVQAIASPAAAGSEPARMAYDPFNGDLYVASYSSGTVSVISAATNSVVTTISGLAGAFGVAYVGSNNYVYVTSYTSATLYVISPESNSVVFTPLLPSPALDIAYDARNGYLYAAMYSVNEVAVIDAANNSYVTNIPVGTYPRSLAVDTLTGDIFVSDTDSNQVTVISGSTNTVLGNISVDAYPMALTFDEANGDIYVPCDAAGTVDLINGATGSVVDVIPGENSPVSALWDGSNDEIYVANVLSNNVSVIAGATNTIVANITDVGQPYGLEYDSAIGTVYVSNLASSTIGMIAPLSAGATTSSNMVDAGQALITAGGLVKEGSGRLSDFSSTYPNSGGLSCITDPMGWVSIPSTCLATSAGSYTDRYSINDTLGGSVWSTLAVSVVSDPSVSAPSPSVPSLDIGHVVSFSTTPSLGTLVYPTITWTAATNFGCVASGPGLTCTPLEPGTYKVSVYIVDSNGYTSPVAASSAVTVFAAPQVTSISASRASADLGQGVRFTASPASGTGNYSSFAWTDPAPMGCTSSVTSTLDCTPTNASGSPYTISVVVTDSNGGVSTSFSTTFTVYTDPSAATPTASVTSVDVGQLVKFTTSGTGGSLKYASFAWSVSAGLGCSGSTTPTLNCTGITPGSYNISVSVTDTNGVASPNSTFTGYVVHSDPTVSVPIGSTSSIDLGATTIIFTTNPSGGTGSYLHYTWSSAAVGCSGVTTLPTSSCSPGTTGTFTVTVTVTDSNGVTSSVSVSAPFKVYSDPTVASITENRSSADVGQFVTFTATGAGGNGVYGFVWGILVSSWTCNSQSLPSISCSSSGAGMNPPVEVYVYDTNGGSSGFTSTGIYDVYTDPTAQTPTAAPTSVDVGQTVNFTASGTGGRGTYSYSWSVPAGLDCSTTSANVLPCVAVTAGTYSVAASVTDSNGFTSAFSTLTGYVVGSDPRVAPSLPSRNSMDLGDVVVFVATASGGQPGYSFTWHNYVAADGCVAAVSKAVGWLNCTPTSPAVGSSLSPSVTVSDTTGVVSAPANFSVVTIYSDPSVAFVPSLPSGAIDVGQSVWFNATATGGSGGYIFSWIALPTGCANSGVSVELCAPTAAGIGITVEVQVYDSNGHGYIQVMLYTVDPDPMVSLPVASPVSGGVDVGQTVMFTTTASYGTGTYRYYTWAASGLDCAPSNTSSVNCTALAAGTFTVSVTVTDTNGRTSVPSPAAGYLVYKDVVVSLAPPTKNSLDVGLTVTFAATVAGGVASFAFSWIGYAADDGCVVANIPVRSWLNCTPTAPASGSALTVTVSVRDGNGVSSVANSSTVTIFSAPTAPAPIPSRPNIDIGQSVTFTEVPTGGTGLYVYSWLELSSSMGCTSSTTSTDTCIPTSTGYFTGGLEVIVYDSNGGSSTGTLGTFQVFVDPAVTNPVASRSSVDVGQSVGFHTTASNGTSTYPTYTWEIAAGMGCDASTGASTSCVALSPGTYRVNVTVTDSSGFTSAVAELTYVVYADPEVTSPGPTVHSVDLGQSVTFSTTAALGFGPYPAYTWSAAAGMGCAPSTGSSLNCTPLVPGAYSVTVTANDSNGATSAPASDGSFLVYGDPTITALTSSVRSADLGQTVTFEAIATQGTGNYTSYAWSTPAGLGCASSTTYTLVCTPTSATGSPFPVSVRVTDTNFRTSSAANASFVVYAAPTISGLTVSSATVDVNQSVTFTATAALGTGAYLAYQWSAPAGLGCPVESSSSITCIPTTATGSPFTISAQVTDTNGISSVPASSSVQVDLDPVVATPVPSVGSVDVGQVVEFTTSATLGSTHYTTYSWSIPSGLGCAVSHGSAVNCTALSPGVYRADATVTDSNGFTSSAAVSGNFTVFVDPSVTSPSPSAPTRDLGQSVVFSTTVSGGDLNYVGYAWTTPSALGCVSSSTNRITCAPTQPGTYRISVNVTDTNGAHSAWASLAGFVVFADPTVSSPQSAISGADVGQSVVFTTFASLGTQSYTAFTWTYPSGLGCTSSTTSTLSCAPTTPGTPENVSVTVTDSNGVSSTAAFLLFTVNADPVVSTPVPSVTAADVGGSVTFNAVPSLGSGAYLAFAWTTPAGLGCTSSNVSTITCGPTSNAASPYTVTVTVTDSRGVRSLSASVTFAVNAGPVISSATASVSQVDVGQTLSFTATASLGTGKYLTYQWSVPSGLDCGLSTTTVLGCTAIASGSYNVSVRVMDSEGVYSPGAYSGNVAVYGAVTVAAPSASSTAIDVGGSVTLRANASGGLSPYTYTWNGVPASCGKNASTISCVAGSAGSWTISVTVLDSLKESVVSLTLEITVTAPPSVSGFNSSVSAADVGQMLVLSAGVNGGAGTLSYQWTGLPTGCTSINAPALDCTPSASGTFFVTLRVTDAQGTSNVSKSLTLTISPSLRVAPVVVSTSWIEVGQPVTFSVAASGGSSGIHYTWSGLPAGCSAADSSSISCHPSTAGGYTVSATVTDSNGEISQAAGASLEVSPALGTPTLNATAASVQKGQALGLSVSVAGGIEPLTYEWSGLPSGCAAADTASLVCVPQTVGTYHVQVTVRDSSGASVNSSALTVSVTSPPQGSSFTSGTNGLTWLLLALVIIALALAIIPRLIRKKDEQDTPSPPPSPPSPRPDLPPSANPAPPPPTPSAPPSGEEWRE